MNTVEFRQMIIERVRRALLFFPIRVPGDIINVWEEGSQFCSH